MCRRHYFLLIGSHFNYIRYEMIFDSVIKCAFKIWLILRFFVRMDSYILPVQNLNYKWGLRIIDVRYEVSQFIFLIYIYDKLEFCGCTRHFGFFHLITVISLWHKYVCELSIIWGSIRPPSANHTVFSFSSSEFSFH